MTTEVGHHVLLQQPYVRETNGEVKMDASNTHVVVGRDDSREAEGVDQEGEVRQVDD